jgi:large subunit ribosomal protein L21
MLAAAGSWEFTGFEAMYAVFEDGSRQYIVNEGDVLRVDYRDAEIGDTVEFDRVLLYKNEDDLQIGQPLLAGARVIAEVIDQTSQKYHIQHFRRRKNYRRFKGHRQPFTAVEVLYILRAGEEPEYEDEEEQPAGAESPSA